MHDLRNTSSAAYEAVKLETVEKKLFGQTCQEVKWTSESQLGPYIMKLIISNSVSPLPCVDGPVGE